MVGRALERAAFWLGLLTVAVPNYLLLGMLAVEKLLGLGVYDPALGGDPLLHQRRFAVVSPIFLLFAFAQIGSLAVQKVTLAGRDKWLRNLLGHAGLVWACFTDLSRTLPELFPDIATFVAAAFSLLLFLGAIAACNARAPVVVYDPPPD